VAVKQLKEECLNRYTEEFLNEVQILFNLQHEHIITCKGAYMSATRCQLVTEFARGGDLAKAIANLPHLVVWDCQGLRIAWQVARALWHMHSRSIPVVHRDLKPQNILLTENLAAKVADFGLSKLNNDEDMTVQDAISHNYSAPEVFRGERGTEKIDIYSFGVILKQLTLVCGSRSIKAQPLPEDVCPPQLRALIQAYTSDQPVDRPSAAELIKKLRALMRAHCPETAHDLPSRPISPVPDPVPMPDTDNLPAVIIDAEADKFLSAEVGLPRQQVQALKDKGYTSYKLLKYLCEEDLKAVDAQRPQLLAFRDHHPLHWPDSRDGGTRSDPAANDGGQAAPVASGQGSSLLRGGDQSGDEKEDITDFYTIPSPAPQVTPDNKTSQESPPVLIDERADQLLRGELGLSSINILSLRGKGFTSYSSLKSMTLQHMADMGTSAPQMKAYSKRWKELWPPVGGGTQITTRVPGSTLRCVAAFDSSQAAQHFAYSGNVPSTTFALGRGYVSRFHVGSIESLNGYSGSSIHSGLADFLKENDDYDLSFVCMGPGDSFLRLPSRAGWAMCSLWRLAPSPHSTSSTRMGARNGLGCRMSWRAS